MSTAPDEMNDLNRPEGESDTTPVVAETLESMIQRFRAETAYPSEAHKEQMRLREEWRQKLLPENIGTFTRRDLTHVASHGNWGSPQCIKPQVQGVPKWIRDLDDTEYESLLGHLEYLCWGDDELSVRYDSMVNPASPRKVKWLRYEVTSKLLAICHPDRFIPIGCSIRKDGYMAWLEKLGIDPASLNSDQRSGRPAHTLMLLAVGLTPPDNGSRGDRVVAANDILRDQLEPYFRGDLTGMSTFLHWLLNQEPPVRPNGSQLRGLPALADELLIDVEFLDDIVDLLNDKGQVILYGPPGTGKTYLARELAKELAPDESRRTLVQFHPSTSYEDFFEGYRPAGTDDGGIRYELTPGPLARMAEQAAEAPDQRHVMVIDEINRGNLPRVLGELLFLLEYRDEKVRTLYRSDTLFALPKNLWVIGTMNTADRSIALVDAALRRRFHFVPFFPDREPMAGLLGRWMSRENQPAWVGRLVDAVNDELKRDLEGSHLLLGPSHFMKDYGSTSDEQRDRLRRIWEYNIEPFIEDQFFGDPDRIRHYRFAEVLARYGPTTQSAADEGGTPTGITSGAPTDPADDDSEAEIAEVVADEAVPQ